MKASERFGRGEREPEWAPGRPRGRRRSRSVRRRNRHQRDMIEGAVREWCVWEDQKLRNLVRDVRDGNAEDTTREVRRLAERGVVEWDAEGGVWVAR